MSSIFFCKRAGVVLLLLVLVSGFSRVASVLANDTVLMAQTWATVNESTGASAIAVDNSGNIYIAGGIAGSTNVSALLLKYNSTGSLLLTAAWGGATGTTSANGLTLLPSGEIYLTGYTSAFGNGGDLLLLKFFTNGSFGWARTWGGPLLDSGASAAVDAKGNIYVTGYTESYGSGPADAVILKFSSSGALLWARTWGGAKADYGSSVVADSSGVYVGGSEDCSGAGTCDAFILKLNSTGDLIFQKSWGGSKNDYGYGIALNSFTGALYLVGSTSSYGAGGAFVLKFDTSGNLLWQRVWGPADGYGVTLDSRGNIIVVGNTQSFGTTNGTAFVIRLDSGGDLINEDTWGAQKTRAPGTIAYGVATDSLGNAYVAGSVVAPPPYSIGMGNSTLGIPNLPVNNLNFATVPTNQTLGMPSGIITHPSGTETFNGGGDAFFFKISIGVTGINTITFSFVMLALLLPLATLARRRKVQSRHAL